MRADRWREEIKRRIKRGKRRGGEGRVNEDEEEEGGK